MTQDPRYDYESKYVRANGIRLHYLEWQGPGRPLLIVHGNSHAGGVYAPLGQRLSSDFHVFAVDQRGHGLSQRPGSYTRADCRDDIAGFIEALDLRDVLIVAHSSGGGASLLTCAVAPDRIAGLATYEPTLPWNAMLRARIADMTQRVRGRRSVFPSRQAMFEHFRSRGGFKDYQPEYLQAYVDHAAIEREDGQVELANPPEVESQMYATMLDGAEWQAMGEVAVPVLRIVGEQTQRAQPEDNDAQLASLRRHFPLTQSRIQPNSTHSGPFEHPEVFEASIREFAASLSGPEGA